MNNPKVVSRAEWLSARKELLQKEKAFTRLKDQLSAERRQMPIVQVEEEYRFTGDNGTATLSQLFGPHPQLIVYHFMFDPGWEEGCKSCSLFADNFEGAILHFGARNTAFAVVSKAPLEKLAAFKHRMGWNFPWYSSFDNNFNTDFQVTIDTQSPDSQYNFRSAADLFQQGKIWFTKGELPGMSVFLRDGGKIFHSYSTYQRGLDLFMNTYNLLDHTPLGRQEDDQRIMAWVRHHDRYESNTKPVSA